MTTPGKLAKSTENILIALVVFGFLTAEQVTRLCFSRGSLTYSKALLKSLVDAQLALPIGGRGTSLPLIYTLTGKGRTLASSLSGEQPRRFRPAEARKKQLNTYFMRHLLAVNDVLIAAQLLAKTRPDITVTRLYREPELRRRIYVEVPDSICVEPDASIQFLMIETGHDTQQIWEDFFHIEAYRNLPPVEHHFKQKIQGYVTYVGTGQHEALFETSALSIAVIATTNPIKAILKRWTEDALQAIGRSEDGEMFFFGSVNPATASPEELFLSPVWEQAFGQTTTPLLVLE